MPLHGIGLPFVVVRQRNSRIAEEFPDLEEPGKDLSVTIDNMKWDLDAKIADEAFTFSAPEGVKKINLLSPDEIKKK